MAQPYFPPTQTVNDTIMELSESVTEAYLHPSANISDKNERMCF